MKPNPIHIIHSKADDLLSTIASESVHLFITDPPYFIDGMGSDWDASRLELKAEQAGVIGSMPVGMKFDPRQSKAFGDFMAGVAVHVARILKPGGFAVVFSQARLYHRMAVAFEDAGFEIRDMLGWTYEGQAKAFSQRHFVERMVHLSELEKDSIVARLGGRKTPQLKPCIEPMVLAQKPKCGTFVQNWLEHETGLVDVSQTLEPGKFPGNLMPCAKPGPEEKGAGNTHLTVKPLKLMKHLIRLFSVEDQMVCDPFLGSGTTAVAAKMTGRKFIGCDIEERYVRMAQDRVSRCEKEAQ
jgi:site-specific DNA-methyltransferase (adenine-specific)